METKIKPGIIINMRNRLWRVDEFDGTEAVAAPITGDSNDQRMRFIINSGKSSKQRCKCIAID
jgi:hypothetical protein